MWKLFSENPARTSFYSFSNVTQRVLWRILKEYMDMVWIYCDLYYLNIHFYTGFTDNTFAYHCYITDKHLPPVFWGENKMVGQQ